MNRGRMGAAFVLVGLIWASISYHFEVWQAFGAAVAFASIGVFLIASDDTEAEP